MKRLLSLMLAILLAFTFVSCEPDPAKDSSITLDKESLEIQVGSKDTLKATVFPSDAVDQTVTWESSNTDVATVENGVVTAIGKGTATITAKAGDKTATCMISVYDAIPSFITDGSLNKTIDKLYVRWFEDTRLWAEMYTYRGFSMASLPESEVNAFLNAFNDRHSADVGLAKDKSVAKFDDGIMTLSLWFKDDVDWIYTLTNDTTGDWKLEIISKNSDGNIGRRVTYTFEPDENGNIRSWFIDGERYSWSYVDPSLIDFGHVIQEIKTLDNDHDLINIEKYYKTDDIRTAMEGTVILKKEKFDKNGDLKWSSEVTLHRNQDSSLIWYENNGNINSFLWNSDKPCPLNDSLTGNFPPLIKQEMLSQLSPKSDIWDFNDFKLRIMKENAKYMMILPITSCDKGQIHAAFDDSSEWNKKSDNPDIYISENGISASFYVNNTIGFTYDLPEHITIFESLIAGKPVQKDKYTVTITKIDGTKVNHEISRGDSYTIPENIREGVTVPDDHAFVMKDGNEQFFPGQRIIGNRDYDIYCSVVPGTKGLVYGLNASKNCYEVTQYRPTKKDVVIPEQHEGKKVAGIEFGAFMNRDIQSVMLPETLEYIGFDVFKFSQIQYITIPKNFKTVSQTAFNNCEKLKKITFCGSGTANNYSVFQGCDNIEEMVLQLDSTMWEHISYFFKPTPEHPLTVHFTDKSVTYTK